ncbi:hypothetical protein FE257_007100 [Aspergillus nanangensis]|uniref:Uncharacterized protein n=1 Tax=Aspergillus nanangensis TaxID=2582783 RepID=A0AAD4CPY9_ASPNN|nr:hypothetical protein FE257_007100 [Aspergillus nanangensis]
MALAIAVVKHKPAHLHIKDYILQIRQCLKPTNELNHSQSQDQYFDSVLFWKQAFEKSEGEQSKLLDRIYDLERHNEALRLKTQSPNTNSEPDKEPLKRKGTTQRGACKRAKTKLSAAARAPLNQSASSRESPKNQDEYLEESTASFMRHVFMLQKAMQKRQGCSEIVHATAMLCKIISDDIHRSICQGQQPIPRPKKTSRVSQKAEFSSLFPEASGALHLLPQALKKLSGSENFIQEKGQLTYHIVHLYKSILDALHQHFEIIHEQTRPNPGSKSTRPTRKETKNVKPETSTDIALSPMNGIATMICQALNSMVLSLDVSCSAHYDLLEGFIFHVLGRVGRSLRLFVFRDARLHLGLTCDSSKLPLPSGMNSEVDERVLRVAEMEGRCLIWILERLLAMSSNALPVSTTRQMSSIPKNVPLLRRFKERLQGTLLQAVFDESAEWDKAILCPAQTLGPCDIKELRSSLPISDMSVPEWFTQEVWRLVGWDMLTTGFPSGDGCID